jgi:CBS domain-containing protein
VVATDPPGDKEVDSMKVKELMSESPVAVGPDTLLREVAAILSERRISGVPVIGERLEVLGVVSEADILIKERGPEPRHGGLLGWLLAGGQPDERKLAARTAAEAMTSPAVTVGPEYDVSKAARLMTDSRIKRLPVVDAAGMLVGIVTRADLVRAFARSDEEIEREIQELVLHTLWIEEPGLEVRVERGEVRLSGKLERRSDAELLPRFVAGVPGVVTVHSTLRWGWDDRKATKDDSRFAGASRGG